MIWDDLWTYQTLGWPRPLCVSQLAGERLEIPPKVAGSVWGSLLRPQALLKVDKGKMLPKQLC